MDLQCTLNLNVEQYKVDNNLRQFKDITIYMEN